MWRRTAGLAAPQLFQLFQTVGPERVGTLLASASHWSFATNFLAYWPRFWMLSCLFFEEELN